jgi:guanylate kinase
LEHAQVHGDFYGTLREPVVTNLRSGTDVLIDIDTQGAAAIRDCNDPFIGGTLVDIFIMPPNLDELRRRLRKRGTETDELNADSRTARAKWSVGANIAIPLSAARWRKICRSSDKSWQPRAI